MYYKNEIIHMVKNSNRQSQSKLVYEELASFLPFLTS